MVFITEDLVRKRAEHNEGMISTLEELSLHQLDIEKIEHLDKWCRDLKILYLQANLISKIENVGRFKRLEYLNLALNNITKIENLSGCESLTKLDLTLNFVKELTSVAELSANFNLSELYLSGNPCTQYAGYRHYVIVTLPQLKVLDGLPIRRMERMQALQEYETICLTLKQQEEDAKSSTTEMPSSQHRQEANSTPDFWSTMTENNPETRRRIYEEMEKVRNTKDGAKSGVNRGKKPPRKLETADGRILNINEPKVDFKFVEENDCTLSLDVAVYRYMDTSSIRVELQPTYLQIYILEKLLQLTLPDEIKPEDSVVQRSEATGHLLLRMPKVDGCIGSIQKPAVQVQLNTRNRPLKNPGPECRGKSIACSVSEIEIDYRDTGDVRVLNVKNLDSVSAGHCVSGSDTKADDDVPPLV